MPLTGNAYRKHFDIAQFTDAPVVADDHVFKDGALSAAAATGNVGPLVAGEIFVGFASEECDNTGGGAAEKRVSIKRFGTVLLDVASVTAANRGDKVYASDDDTFVLSASGNSLIGVVSEVPENGKAWVWFDAYTSQIA